MTYYAENLKKKEIVHIKRFCTLLVALIIVFSFAISPLSDTPTSGVMTVDAESIDTIQALVPGLTGSVLSEFDEDMNTIGVT